MHQTEFHTHIVNLWLVNVTTTVYNALNWDLLAIVVRSWNSLLEYCFFLNWHLPNCITMCETGYDVNRHELGNWNLGKFIKLFSSGYANSFFIVIDSQYTTWRVTWVRASGKKERQEYNIGEVCGSNFAYIMFHHFLSTHVSQKMIICIHNITHTSKDRPTFIPILIDQHHHDKTSLIMQLSRLYKQSP